jgi:hypothetical protein
MAVPVHPCQFSPEVVDAIRPLISPWEHVHDPFAGTGLRLGSLCDEIGATFTGGDIEVWPGHDPRVLRADALDAWSYPMPHWFTVVTSPVYLNKRLADYADGPKPTTKVKGRRDYGISLGRALHANNLARHTGRASRSDAYWTLHAQAAKHWRHRVLLNVDGPLAEGWTGTLHTLGYRVDRAIPVYTQRYGGLHNADKRAEFEVLLVATR